MVGKICVGPIVSVLSMTGLSCSAFIAQPISVCWPDDVLLVVGRHGVRGQDVEQLEGERTVRHRDRADGPAAHQVVAAVHVLRDVVEVDVEPGVAGLLRLLGREGRHGDAWCPPSSRFDDLLDQPRDRCR